MIEGVGFTNRAGSNCCGREVKNLVCEPPIITGQSWIPTVSEESTVLLIGKNFTWVTEATYGTILNDNLISISFTPKSESTLIIINSECGQERFILKAKQPTEQKIGFYYTELFGHKKEGWGSSAHNNWWVIWDNQRTNNDFIIPLKGKDNSGMENWQTIKVERTGLYRLVYNDYITTNAFRDGWVSVFVNNKPIRSEPISYTGQLSLNEIITLNKGYEVRIVISIMEDVQRKLYSSYPRPIMESSAYKIIPEGELGGKFRLEFLI